MEESFKETTIVEPVQAAPESSEKKTRADFADQIQDAEEELVRDQLVICELVSVESRESADYDAMRKKRDEDRMASFAAVSNETVMDEVLVNNDEPQQVVAEEIQPENDVYKKLYRRSKCPEGDRVTEATENDLMERLNPEDMIAYLIKRERLENLIKDPVNNGRYTYNLDFYQTRMG